VEVIEFIIFLEMSKSVSAASATKARQPFESIKTDTLNKTPETFSKIKYEAERKESALTTAKKAMNTLQDERNKQKLMKQKQEEYQKIVQKFEKVRQCKCYSNNSS
jgi:N-acyl-D-aspartate/D-glutamate deacylase